VLTSELEGDTNKERKGNIKKEEISPSIHDSLDFALLGFRHLRGSRGDVSGPGVRGSGELSEVDQSGGRDLTTGNDGQEVGSGSTSPVQGNGLTLNDGSL
jgi:hypothetical protein